MDLFIGRNRAQSAGYKAFIPARFPLPGLLDCPPQLLTKATNAERLVGKLDGVTHNLPDADFFISMYVVKDATNSAQIEGTQATMLDAIELDAGLTTKQTDAEDILYYIKALKYGIERLKKSPFSLKLIRELHSTLMKGARSSHFSDPGEFRRKQNWIGGTSPKNAAFVPPPVTEMNKALRDLEKFIHADTIIPILHAAILHGQFETIHPFLDGNGRTGRLMTTLFLYERSILEKPVLFLSSYFKKHQKVYYQKIDGYHNGKVDEWIEFFLDGVIEIANQSIDASKLITKLREQDMIKIQGLGKREATSGVQFLQKLFNSPIVSVKTVVDQSGYTRAGAQKLIDRFIDLEILKARNTNTKYAKSYIYKSYIDIFNK